MRSNFFAAIVVLASHAQADYHILFAPYMSGELKNTNNCMQNVESVNFIACEGDVLNLNGCNPGSYGDTRMRLYLEGVGGLYEVNENDDYCDLVSNHRDYLVITPGCNLYRLDLGCYKDETCGLNVTGTCEGECHAQPTLQPTQSPSGEGQSPITFHPTMEPTTFPFTYQSGELSNTINAYYDVESVHFTLCGAQDVYLNGCDGSEGDPFFRLYREDNGKNIEVASNDDYCDLKPRIHYGLPPGEPCHSYRLDIGCYDIETCSATVNAYCDGCPTPEPTKAPTHAGTMYYYYDDSLDCETMTRMKAGKHHMELTAYNYLCIALDQCTQVGSQLYMKATLHYTQDSFTDYQNSQYWLSPAPTTITYYPDENCMYPIADVNSDCTYAIHECCTLGSANLMGESLSIVASSGKIPVVYSWPDDCTPASLVDAHDADDWTLSDNTLPYQGTVYNKHIQRIEEALQRGHNNFGLASAPPTTYSTDL